MRARGTASSRAYDHLYDATFTVSGERDFYRSSNRGMMADGVRAVVDTVNMFSDLPQVCRRQPRVCGAAAAARRA